MPMPAVIHHRVLFFAVFALCAGLIGFGLYLQHVVNLQPCPLCILQRFAVIATGVVALIAGLHHPRGWGRRIYALLIFLLAGSGAGVAARQIWLQHNPPTSIACGPDLEFMLDSFPLTQALPMLFKGTGDCAKVQWTLLNLSIPEWSFANFMALIVVAVVIFVARRR